LTQTEALITTNRPSVWAKQTVGLSSINLSITNDRPHKSTQSTAWLERRCI